jgi:uncharacterized membrane protein
MKNTAKKEKASLVTRLRVFLRRPLISGLLIVVPLGITVFVLKFLYDFTAGRLAPLIRTVLDPMPHYAAPAVACALLFSIVYFVGMIASAVVGRRLIALAEAFIQRLPLVKSVYGASKQVVESFSFQNQRPESRAVALVEFPCPGMKSIGFVTGTLRMPDGRLFCRVFIPTTPNITVGLFLLVPIDEVYRCETPIDEAVKMVVSGGILGADRLMLQRGSQAMFTTTSPSAEEDEEEL